MLVDRLEARDLEVLRTLARLRYVTKHEFAATMFPSAHVTARRLRKLAELDLVRVHTHGVPDRLGYCAWRLTPAGVELVETAFPDEPLADGLVAALPEGSLRNIEHREALTRIYLRLVVGAEPPAASEADVAAVRARARGLRARAEQFFWQPDGDVTLRGTVLRSDPHGLGRVVHEERVIPDATVSARFRRVRVFVELDRSTNTHKRLRSSMQRYRRHFDAQYAKDFPDGRAPHLLIVVPTAARRDGLAREAAQVFGVAGPCVVAQQAEALVWLEEHLFDHARLTAAAVAASALTSSSAPTTAPEGLPISGDLPAAARAVYLNLHAYRDELRRAGSDLPEETRRALRVLRRELEKLKEDDHAR